MIEKQNFYHGAALVSLVEDARFQHIKKDLDGCVVNGNVFVLMKYRTNTKSPWNFIFNEDDLIKINNLDAVIKKIVIVLICGGDGICAISGEDLDKILGNQPGWVAVRRKFNQQYGV